MNNSHQIMKDEEARSITVVEVFRVADRKAQEMTTKLTEAKREKKSAKAALDRAEKQAKAQRKQLRQTKVELATVKDQIRALTKKLKEAEKAKE